MKISSQSSSAHKNISLNPNLNFLQINQTSLRGVGESSQKALGWILLLVEPAASKGERRKAFILIPQKLAVGN
jgi:hypothetical protein